MIFEIVVVQPVICGSNALWFSLLMRLSLRIKQIAVGATAYVRAAFPGRLSDLGKCRRNSGIELV
ncbi:MAG: hypothetical protein COW62_02705 [Zetaproteobacteria bacterium CG17_big_fil_post_rev_8_21_14_2_50_50_13]|nr:MAG: hypothetical protein AUJ56_09905 [Zetaproteobacteria bacterium CG1_02_49_23]PIQ34235.1 MAG: hypothetical protein COW62_02705 [Zetaproteobacteria bacterium CG17_big_fil_post_rev_8_21_14_2_50_50_13]PIY57154.1 MAG: hypothetical protein COZ00_00560 [Zetaproteobacteria bacterium CG_4_10_14_0_8_um_filter_49_80]